MNRKKQRNGLSPEACVFCRSDVNNEFLYGKLLHGENLSAHQNCLFFSSGLKQRGEKDSDGLLGFLTSDIKEEVLRGQRLRCYSCKKVGATIGCCDNKCRRTYHFPCGLKYHSLHQHFGSFMSFCVLHKPKQDPVVTPEEEFFCRICFMSLVGKESDTYLHSPCCKNNWFHRTCLQEYALSAGRYFFKCPLCNNNAKFLEEMLVHGIYVPDQDASWELSENAFQELLYRPECGAATCSCKHGRKFSGTRRWVLLSCSICGSQARHKFCGKLKDCVKSWKCSECKCLENKIKESKHLEGMSKEQPNVLHPNSRSQHLVSLGSPSKSNSSSDSSSSSLKSITNTLIRTKEKPVTSDSGSSGVKIKPQAKAASKFSVKRKNTDELEPSNELNEKTTTTTPLASITGTKKRMKSSKQATLKIETSDTFVPYIVICSPAKFSKVPLNHWSKKKNKTTASPCCSNSNKCIKKMFGLECLNYRI